MSILVITINTMVGFCIAYENILKKYNGTSLLVTQKDYVKIKDFGLNLSILELKTTISPNLSNKIALFVKSYQNSDKIYRTNQEGKIC